MTRKPPRSAAEERANRRLLERYMATLVDVTPPLTVAQTRRLRALLAPVLGADHCKMTKESDGDNPGTVMVVGGNPHIA